MKDVKSKSKIVIVDDEERNLELLDAILTYNGYDVIKASSGEECLDKLNLDTHNIDLIMLDIMMPVLDGYEVCRRIKSNPDTKNIPIIFITALSEEINEKKGLELGAVDYIRKPFSREILEARIKTHIELKKYRDNLEEVISERTKELEFTQLATVETLSLLAEYRDPETGEHITRTIRYVRAIAEQLSRTEKYKNILSADKIYWLSRAAPLHDIGKVGIKDYILLKPCKLTEEEFEQMKKHTIYGRDVIEATEKQLGKSNHFLTVAKEITMSHHEKWDGTGYTQGLKGEEIPLSARIMAISDVYDALRTKRVYKPAFSHQKARDIIIGDKGKHFDPDIVDAFLAIEKKFINIASKFDSKK